MPNDFMQQLIRETEIFGLLGIVFYVYLAFCLTVMARKIGIPNGWMAWVPIANMVLVCRMAKRPASWVLLLLIPFLDIVILFILLMDVARARGKSPGLVFLLLIPPVGMLFLPAWLAMGPAIGGGAAPPDQTASPAPSTPATCPACGRTECVGEEFCGYTGKPIAGMRAATAVAPEDAPPPGQPAAAAPSGLLVKFLAALVLIAGLLTTGYSLFSRIFSHPGGGSATATAKGAATTSNPARRAAGTLNLFPVDTASPPAHPVSVVSQRLDQGNGAFKFPAKWLPPGVSASKLKSNDAATITSAEYKTAPRDPPVDVHIVDVGPRAQSASAASTMTSWISDATGATPTGVKVTAPDGQEYAGQAVKTSRMRVYILSDPGGNAVVIIYAGDPAAQVTADRLAGNVGNGQGLNDYPQASSMINLTPDTLAGGLQLESTNTMDTASLVSPDELKSLIGDSPQAQQWIDQAKSYMPATVTAATYRDPSRRPWDVLIGDFGGTVRAMYTWLAMKFLVGLSGMQSTSAGYTIEQSDGRYLLQRAGRYIYYVRAPQGEAMDSIAQAARSFGF